MSLAPTQPTQPTESMQPAPDVRAVPVPDPRVARRMHLLAVSVALIVLAFVQAPGRIAPDTKADLSIDPVHFLLRAVHLWDPLGDSGQLQNQAYGYFLPMGPFYAAGHAIGVPDWMVQRAWWALLLLVAFHGMYRLCRRFGAGDHPGQVIAALTFALGPRIVTELGAVSIEAWPTAVAPWVLLPLVKVRPGREKGAAARSGLVIALCGGVNAVAVGAVLPLPVWWLITRRGGRLKRRLSAWWALAAVLGMFWWLAPLLLLGKYSPPFLAWVESSADSTSKASLPSALHGTTQWVAWFKAPEPLWPAGWSVLDSPAGIVLSFLLVVLAVLGMIRRDTPHRRFLIGASIAGLVLLTAGHTGPLTAPWSGSVQDFLDAAGAALRNTHKFDVDLRLPLTLALAHALSKVRLPAMVWQGRPLPNGANVLRFIAACALVGTAAPALVGQIPPVGTFTRVPAAWYQAAAWLKQHDDGARTLVVPGSSFATSIWGDPHDEPFQALARTEWATRSGVPLSSAGNIRVLNTIEQQLETGRGSPGLAQFLARAGISRVLLRSDLVRSFQPGSPPLPVVVRSALQDSPGLTPVAFFGPVLQGERNAITVADDGLDVPQRQIEIWQVGVAAHPVDVEPAADALRVAGGPESLLTLAEANLLGARPVVLAGDPQAAALQQAPLVDTDTIQRREANFAQVRDNYSDVMTATQPYQQERRVHDWIPFAAPQVVARYEGISGVTSSSQAAASAGPWHALDGDTSTAWTSSVFAVGQWLEVTFPQPVSLPAEINLTPGPGGARIAQVRIDTDAGSETSATGAAGGSAPEAVAVPGGITRRLRLTVTQVWPGQELAPVSIAELALPGITVRRDLVLPPPPGTAAPRTIALENARDGVDGCVFSNAAAVCSPRLQQQSEDDDLDRVANLPAGGTYTVTATARVKATPLADALLRRPGTMTATASSRWTDDPALRPDAAVDRDPGTAWIAASTDPRPELTVSWPKKRLISRIQWQVSPALAASRPAALQVVVNGVNRTVTPDPAGWVTIPPVRTDRVRLVVTGVTPLQSLDRASGYSTPLPVGASEIVIPGADQYRPAQNASAPVLLPCGAGPALLAGGRTIATRVNGTVAQVLHRDPMTVTACSSTAPVTRPPAQPTAASRPPVRMSALARKAALTRQARPVRVILPAGPVSLRLLGTRLLEPQQLVFQHADPTAPTALKPTASTASTGQTGPPVPTAGTAPVSLVEKSSEHRIVTVAAASAAQVLIVHENANPGWRATLHGRRLTSVRIDGWQQGWIVPAGVGGPVDLRFTPGGTYRLALLVGFLFLLLLAGIGTADRRRRRRVRRRTRSAAAATAAGTTTGDVEAGGPDSGELPAPVRLEEAGSGWLDSLLAIAVMAALGGFWGLAALLVVVVVTRRWRRLGRFAAGFGALAGITAARSINADDAGLTSKVSIAASLLLVACLLVALDADGGRVLAVVVHKIPPHTPAGPDHPTPAARWRARLARISRALGPGEPPKTG